MPPPHTRIVFMCASAADSTSRVYAAAFCRPSMSSIGIMLAPRLKMSAPLT